MSSLSTGVHASTVFVGGAIVTGDPRVPRTSALAVGAGSILSGGVDVGLVPAAGFDAIWLDHAVPDRPAVLRAADYHTAWANTAVLRLGGVDANTLDPPSGEIVRRPDGSPLGTLRESAQDLVLSQVPAPDAPAGWSPGRRLTCVCTLLTLASWPRPISPA